MIISAEPGRGPLYALSSNVPPIVGGELKALGLLAEMAHRQALLDATATTTGTMTPVSQKRTWSSISPAADGSSCAFKRAMPERGFGTNRYRCVSQNGRK